MEKNKKNEELQSRREFFKKAAKSALPIVAGVVLASAPTIVKAAEAESPQGCQWSCSFSCTGGCQGCAGSCQGNCRGCTGSCQGTCTSCFGNCYGGCSVLARN